MGWLQVDFDIVQELLARPVFERKQRIALLMDRVAGAGR
jgi:hypothetical protein